MKVLLVSNMYPNEKYPSYGIFVKKFVEELDACHINYTKTVMYKHNHIVSKTAGYFKFYIVTFLKALLGSYDIIYIHYASYSSIPILAVSQLKKVNIYVNLHGSDVIPENKRQEIMQEYTKKILSISKRIIVPSLYFKNLLEAKYHLREDKIFIYPSAGIDKNIFFKMRFPQRKVQRKKYAGNTDIPVFGMASRINKDKGWDVFVKAIEIIKRKDIKAQYIIVGSGTEEKELSNLISECELENDIQRVPLLPQRDLVGFYNAIDFLIFPTKRIGESLGLVAIEAMACGTPVIASDFAAPKYYVTNNINGYKFKINDANDLANKMIYCIENQDIREKLAKGALETADKYDKTKIRKQLFEIFDMEERN